MDLEDVTSGRGNDPSDYVVDVVAVHGIYEGQTETWTDPSTNIFWLRDLLPERLPTARVLTYGYKAEVLLSPGDGSSDRILQHALSLVAVLNADREENDAVDRPLIFMCHGLGGILVKRALAFSNTSTSKRVQHRRSIFISTYAILFLGTPHNGLGSAALKQFSAQTPDSTKASQLLEPLAKGSELLQDINDQFSTLTKHFSLYYFWEQDKSYFGNHKGYVVDEQSAAPGGDNTERAGIPGDHSRMCKFSNPRDVGFKLVLAALRRYVRDAPKIIRSRWREDKKKLKKERQMEAAELLCHDSNLSFLDDSPPPSRQNEHFVVYRSASSIFTGRADLARTVRQKFLTTSVRDGRYQHKIFVLYGLGGSGKTQFCLKFVEDCKESFWGIFWIDASTDQNAEAGYANLGGIANKDTTFEAGYHWLANRSQPWLLVIDNADDPDMDVSRYFPAGGRGHILITTRNLGNVVHATVGEELFRDMEPEDAITLLLKAAHQPGTDDYKDESRRKIAKPIAARLGHLALALTHAGAAIRRNIYTLDSYLPEYCARRRIMTMPQPVDSSDLYELTIITTWEVSVNRIEQQSSTAARDAIDILHVSGFLHFEQIPELLFRKAWNNMQNAALVTTPVGNLFTRFRQIFGTNRKQHLPPMLLQAGPTWDKARFHRALAVLSDLSLIYHDAQKEICSMHPVVHAWARDRLSTEGQKHWLDITTTILSNSITSEFEASGRVYRRNLLPHIDSCLVGDGSMLLRYGNDNMQATKALKFAFVYAECGRWTRAREIQQMVIQIRTKTLGPSHNESLEAMADLGRSCWNLFRLVEGLEVQIKVFETRVKKYGSGNPLTLKSMDDLARTYWLVGRREQSKELGLAAVEGLRDALGAADPATLRAMHNLACTYLHLGQPDKAEKLLTEVLHVRRLFFGAWHDDTLATMTELSMSYLALRRLAEAERLSTEALDKRTHVLGEEHAYTLWAVNNVSKVYCAQDRANEAASILEVILPVVTRTLGPSHVGMSMTKFNLATAYIGLKRWADAERTLREQNAILNPKHPDWISSTSELGRVCRLQGNWREAKKLYLSVIKAILETGVLGIDHPRTRKIVWQLKEMYEEENCGEELEKLRSMVGLFIPPSASSL